MKMRSDNRHRRVSDLEGLYEGPQQDADGVTLPQKLDQPGCSEELQETHVDRVHRLGQMVAERREKGYQTQMVKLLTT